MIEIGGRGGVVGENTTITVKGQEAGKGRARLLVPRAWVGTSERKLRTAEGIPQGLRPQEGLHRQSVHSAVSAGQQP